MPCIRDTRKRVTEIHKKMRTALTKHKRSCNVVKKAMNKFNKKSNPLVNIQGLTNELRGMKMTPACQMYSDTLDTKFENIFYIKIFWSILEKVSR